MTARYQILAEGGVWDFQTRSRIPADNSNAAWQEYRAWLTAGGIPLPPDSIGQDDLPTAQAKRIAEIEAYAAGLRNKVIAGYSAAEMSSWPIKVMEARAYTISGNAGDAPMLSIEATARGITLTDLAAKVLTKADGFAPLEATISGICGKHQDAIRALTDIRDLLVYDWRAGWPL